MARARGGVNRLASRYAAEVGLFVVLVVISGREVEEAVGIDLSKVGGKQVLVLIVEREGLETGNAGTRTRIRVHSPLLVAVSSAPHFRPVRRHRRERAGRRAPLPLAEREEP